MSPDRRVVTPKRKSVEVLGGAAEGVDRLLDGAAGHEDLLLVVERVSIAVFRCRAELLVGEVAQRLLDRLESFDELLGVMHGTAPRSVRELQRAAPQGASRRGPRLRGAWNNRGSRRRRAGC